MQLLIYLLVERFSAFSKRYVTAVVCILGIRGRGVI